MLGVVHHAPHWSAALAWPVPMICLLFYALPAAAQPEIPRAELIELVVPSEPLAERIAAVWQAIDMRAHPVERSEEEWVVRVGLRIRDPLVVPVRDVHGAVRRLFERERQTVFSLPVEVMGDEARVTVDREADRAILVVTGEGASEVPPSPNPSQYQRLQPDGPRSAVRHLGRVGPGERRHVRVPAGAEVSLIVLRFEPLSCQFHDGLFLIRGGPRDPALELTLLVDGEPLQVRPESASASLPMLPRGPHVARAELRRGEELVAWAEHVLPGHARYPLQLDAGGGERCVTLDGDAVADPLVLPSVRIGLGSSIQMRHQAVENDDGWWGPGTTVCVWAPFIAGAERHELELAFTRDREPAVLRIELAPRPRALLIGVPLAAFALFLGLLLWGYWPAPRRPASHLAWRAELDPGYRDPEPPQWQVRELPETPTSLAELDPALAGLAHTVARVGDEADCFFGHRVVVGTLGDCRLAVGDVALRTGSHVFDDHLHLVVLDRSEATRLDPGDVPAAPSPLERQRAWDRGAIVAWTRADPPSRLRVAVLSGLGAALATASPWALRFSGMLWAYPGPSWAGSLGLWLGGFAVAALVVLAVARVGRRRAALAFGR